MNTNLFINPSDQMILNQYQEFINFQNQQQVDTYSQLEKELQTLTDNDVTELSRFEPYVIANNNLSLLIQGELLKMVRQEINKKPEVINSVIEAIKSFKSEKQKGMEEIQDYIKNYSDITFQEYKRLKEENKR